MSHRQQTNSVLPNIKYLLNTHFTSDGNENLDFSDVRYSKWAVFRKRTAQWSISGDSSVKALMKLRLEISKKLSAWDMKRHKTEL